MEEGWTEVRRRRRFKKVVVEEEEKVVVEEEEEEEKITGSCCGHLFVLFDHRVGNTAASLYKIEVPELVPSYSQYYSSNSKKKEKQYCILKEPVESLKPIMEFPYPKYPREMCCVELDSKFYLMGGHFRETHNRHSLGGGNFPVDVHLLDEKKMETNTTFPMHTGKPFPYAFTANGCIFVHDNSMPYLTNAHMRPKSSYFEMFKPGGGGGGRDRGWRQLPDPPYRSVICGHAIFEDRLLFLSCEGNLGAYVLCFNLHKLEWLNKFIYGFSEDHMFYGQAQFLDDTVYAISGHRGSVPSAYPGFTSSYVKFHTSKPNLLDDDYGYPFGFVQANTELFDDIAFIRGSPKDYPGVFNHVLRNWLSASLVYLGNRCFCYIRGGPFPDDVITRYHGFILDYFAPYPGTYNEDFPGGSNHVFQEELLQSSHLKIKFANPSVCGRLQSCFFVSNLKPPMKPQPRMMAPVFGGRGRWRR